MEYLLITEENHKKLCEFFDVEYEPINFEPIRIQKNEKNLKCLHPMFGTKHSEEHIRNLKISRNKRTDKPMLGKHHSQETKDKLSKTKSGISNSKLYKKIKTPDGIFESVSLAANFYGHNIFYMSRKIKKNPDKFQFV
jgi:hypothetical protein